MGNVEGAETAAARSPPRAPESFVIDRLVHQDIPAVCALFRRVWESQRADLPPEIMKSLEPNPLEFTSAMEGVTFFAARREGRPIGLVGIELESGASHLVTLVVDPDHRRQGIGKALTQAALEWAKHAGAATAWTDPLAKFAAAQALLRTLGFTEAGTLHRRLYNQDVVLFERLL